MKQKRAKAYRKQMSYYHLNFKFREPYQLLIDEEIILDAIRTRYDLIEGFKRTVQGEIKPMITQCTMEALYRAKDQDAIDLARTFERRRCNHLPIRKHQNHENDHESDNKNENENDSKNNKKENVKSKEEEGPKSAFDCINSVVNINGKNKHRYIVATQKVGLRQIFRKIPAVPLIYMSRSVMILEPMSRNTEVERNRIESSKLTNGLNGLNDEQQDEEENEGKKRKRSLKEPNPLSIKKKKTDKPKLDNVIEPEPENKSKRRRRKHTKSLKQNDEVEVNS